MCHTVLLLAGSGWVVGSDWVVKGRGCCGKGGRFCCWIPYLDLKGHSRLRIYYPRPTTLFSVLVESIFYSSAENMLVKYKSSPRFLACFFYPYVHWQMDGLQKQLRIRTRGEGAGIWGVGADSSAVLASKVVCLGVWRNGNLLKKILHAITHVVVWEVEGRGWVTCQLLPRSCPVKLASSPQAIFLVWCQFTPNMDGSRLVYTCCYGSFRSGCRQSLEQPLPLLPNSFGTRLNAWFQDDASVSGWCGFYFGKHLSSGQSGRLWWSF